MKIFLWVLQVLLAAQFLQHGIIMVFPPAEYVEIMNATLGIGLRYFIGIAELLAVAGLILPGVL
ncbi:MAG: DoxX family protein, partial [Bacteroidota bacterium]